MKGDIKKKLVLALFALSLTLALTGVLPVSVQATTSPTIGVHVGDTFVYKIVSTAPARFVSIAIVTITSINYPMIYCGWTQIFDNGTIVHLTGNEDIVAMQNNNLGGWNILPANLQAGPWQLDGLPSPVDIHTKRMRGSMVDYTTITMVMGTTTWAAYEEWYQASGVPIYINYNFPPMFVGTITLLAQFHIPI